MKNLLRLSFITFLSLFVISCSGEDGNNNAPTNTPGSFLVEYNGVIWASSNNDSSGAYYISFSQSGATTWDWYDGGDECYEYSYQFGDVDDVGDVNNVISNTSNTLVIGVTCSEDCDGFTEYTLTFTVSDDGNTLSVVDSDFPDEVDLFYRTDDWGGC